MGAGRDAGAEAKDMTASKVRKSSTRRVKGWLLVALGFVAAIIGLIFAPLVGWEMHGELSDSQMFGRALFLAIAAAGILMALSGWWFILRVDKKEMKGV